MKRKAQTEIMGLAVIVLLLALGMLFIVKFVLLRPESTTEQEFVHSQLAGKILNSLIKTTSDCNNAPLADVIQNCVEGFPNGDMYCFNTEEYSCNFINQTIKYILKETLDKWKTDYTLTISVQNQTFFKFSDCTSPNTKSAIQPINTALGDLILRLNICN